MTEQENTNEAPCSLEAGTLLKNQRESLGLTQKSVADRLRLKLSVIDQIERNCFEGQLASTFTRGYIRSYAKLVGLDEEKVLEALEETPSSCEQSQAQQMQSFSRKTKHEKHNSRIMWLTWIIALVLIGISGAWWWQSQQQNTEVLVSDELVVEPIADNKVIDDMDANELIASAPSELVQNTAMTRQAETLDAAVTTTLDAVTTNGAGVDEAATDSDKIVSEADKAIEPQQPKAENEPDTIVERSVAQSPAQNKVTADGMVLLTMAFDSDCWVQIKDASGKTLVSGTRKSGQNIELSGKAPFKVILGAPEGVTMTFASEPVDLSRYTSGKVARFSLPL
ncbi:helix-turn-helix domain-containing protein [Vibrio azureus]|uniref:Cytoskeleton protein RodZ n=1 Tax=Vibrio azureus NBRC 104587 TaxID=1219077 RepID=U3ARQ9_9VIBR|nr:cytoskeleton protein RodZ [Vibrio azureus]AUI85401.1 helix-turn-helix domain-containing protein [Vibrio azureus]GAD76440.1 cytoskeleton protein RodZ [Vibrio azureus NBRC 104587]